MRTRALLAAMTLLPTALIGLAMTPEGCYVAIEGDPTTTDDDIVACEQQTWFHGAETKASNAGNIDPDVPHGSATFDTTPPAGSVTDGEGAGYVTNSVLTQTAGGDTLAATFTGTFTGHIDAVDVDLHVLAELPITANDFNVELAIDGFAVASFAEVLIPRTEDPDTAAATRMDFVIPGLAGFVNEYLGGDTEHTVTLRIEPTYIVNDTTVFAFDTTEVDGGITFNPLTIEDGTTVLSAS